MEATGTFSVDEFIPVAMPESPIATGTPVGVATMTKQFEGDIDGAASTLFASAYDQTSGVGTYMAIESFQGRLHDRSGTFNFAHSATTTGTDRQREFFVIVPGSGTDGLVGITGGGALAVDPDGTHRVVLDYSFDD